MKRDGLLTIIFAIFIVGLIGSFFWFRSPFFGKWTKNQHMGEIVSVEESRIKIATKTEKDKIILLTKETKIMAGPREVTKEELLPKSKIIIIGDLNADGEVVAKVIRLFPPRDKFEQK